MTRRNLSRNGKMRYIMFALSLLAIGCSSSYYRSLNGTSTSVGICVPESDTMRLDVVQYLSGSRVSVRDEGTITHEYSHSASNTYFGVIHTFETGTSKVSLSPKKAETVKSPDTEAEVE